MSVSNKSPTKLEVTSRHEHTCLLGRKALNQTNIRRISTEKDLNFPK